LPRYLTYAASALALFVALASGEVWTGILPGVLVAALVTLDYIIWDGRNRPWHDWTVIRRADLSFLILVALRRLLR